MQASLYADISKQTLTDSLDGSDYSPPKIVAGAHLTFKLRLAEVIEGETVLSSRVVHGIKASIGNLDARPESGRFKLLVGGKTTEFLSYNPSEDALANAINVLDLGAALPCTVTAQDGSYRIRFADGNQRDFDCPDNGLWPLTFVTVVASQFEGAWIHTLRLVQAPACETVDHTLDYAAEPTVSRIQEGGGDDASGVTWNELQRLAIPPDFNAGSFLIKRGYKRTAPIGLPTNAAEIEAALKAIADDGGLFSVIEEQDAVLIEFGGDAMAGRSQELLEVVVTEAPTPFLRFTLETDTAGMDVLMRRPNSAGEVTLPMEILLMLEDEADAETLRPEPIHLNLTFLRPLNRAAASVAAVPNWNQPLQRRDFRPYGPDQFLLGQRHARFPIGNDVDNEYTLNHNLDAQEIFVTVRDNNLYGRQWRDSEFTVQFEGANSLTVSFVDPVPHNAVVVLVTTCNHPSSFVAHTHTIDDVTGLEARLAAIEATLATLNAIAPSGGLIVDVGASDAAVVIAEWKMPQFFDLYPARLALATAPESLNGIAAVLAQAGIKDGGLLPAIHRATVFEMPADPSSVTSGWDGKVYRNDSSMAITIPGGKGRKRDTLYPGQTAAYNGGVWYKVYQDGNSWFPLQFDRTLFELAVNDRQLRFKKSFTLHFGFEVAVVTPRETNLAEWSTSPQNSEAQWSVLLEWGDITEDEQADDEDAPDARDTATNLQGINWHIDAPIFDQRIILTSTATIHEFGCEIMRNAAGELSCNRILYGGKEGATAPGSASFALRARLARFDTRDDVPQPAGLIALMGLNRAVDGAATTGIAQIK